MPPNTGRKADRTVLPVLLGMLHPSFSSRGLPLLHVRCSHKLLSISPAPTPKTRPAADVPWLLSRAPAQWCVDALILGDRGAATQGVREEAAAAARGSERGGGAGRERREVVVRHLGPRGREGSRAAASTGIRRWLGRYPLLQTGSQCM